MKQKILPLAPQALPEKRKIHNSLLLHCRTWRDALKVGIRESYVINTQDDLAEAMEIGRSHFNQIINKDDFKAKKYFDLDRLRELQEKLGNTAVTQWLVLEDEGVLVHQNQPTIEEKAAAFDRMMSA